MFKIDCQRRFLSFALLIFYFAFNKILNKEVKMQNDIKILLGKKIKEIRIKKGLTHEELAEKINIAEKNLSKIECGKSFITADTLQNILEALNIKAKVLFDFDYYKDEELLKEEMLNDIMNNGISIKILYKIYSALK